MKILAFNGSPTKGGNTDALIDQVLEGARTLKLTVEKAFLYLYTHDAHTRGELAGHRI